MESKQNKLEKQAYNHQEVDYFDISSSEMFVTANTSKIPEPVRKLKELNRFELVDQGTNKINDNHFWKFKAVA